MSKILTTHKERLIAYRHAVLLETPSVEEQAAQRKRAMFEYREGMADDIEKLLVDSDLLKITAENFSIRTLATEIARYVTGE